MFLVSDLNRVTVENNDNNNDEMEEETVEENDPAEPETDDGDAPDPTTGPVGQTTEL